MVLMTEPVRVVVERKANTTRGGLHVSAQAAARQGGWATVRATFSGTCGYLWKP